jgi:hypothetical protein
LKMQNTACFAKADPMCAADAACAPYTTCTALCP